MRFAPYALGLCLGLESLACSSSSTTATTILRPELVAVSPDDFLLGVDCSDAPGGVLSYTATLFDVSQADGGTANPGQQLAVSPPTSCLLPVTFGSVLTAPSVIVNHAYLAEVDAYAVDPNTLDLDLGAGQSVEPTWVVTCGGYPPSPAPDAGSGGTTGSAGGSPDTTSAAGEAGGGPALSADDLPGIVSYAAITQTAHNCVRGKRTSN
jgi:hypothetical protein